MAAVSEWECWQCGASAANGEREEVSDASEACDEHHRSNGAQRVSNSLESAGATLNRHHTEHRLGPACVRDNSGG